MKEIGPLAGLRVIDISTMLAAPLVSQILGDFGADVIKVEHPKRPDMLRGHGVAVDGHSLWWKEVNRNKQAIRIDLSQSDGAQLLLELAANTDVIVENFRPGTLERWGIGWEQLNSANPDLILLRVTGFGQSGPYAGRAAFGTLVEAMSGFAALTGDPEGPPTLPPFGLADSIAGVTGAAAVALALYHRDARGGGGQEIDLSLLEPIMMTVGPGPTVYDKLGILQERHGNRAPGTAPRNLYQTSDSNWVAVSTSATTVAARVMELVGRPDLIQESWFETSTGRWEHVDLLDQSVANWIAGHTQEECIRAFTEAGAAIAPVFTAADLVADPQVIAHGMLLKVPDDDIGSLLQHAPLFRLSSTPGRVRFTGREPGKDTVSVLQGLANMTEQRLHDLTDRGIIA